MFLGLVKALLFSQVLSLSLFKLIVTDDSLECFLKPAQNYLASLQYIAFNSILGINSLIHFLPQNFNKYKYSFSQTCPCSTLSANRYLDKYKAPSSFSRVIYHDIMHPYRWRGGGGRQGIGWGFDIFQKFAVKFPAHGQMIPVNCNQISPPRAAHCCPSQGWTQERHNKNISK